MSKEYRPRLLIPGLPIASRFLTWALIAISIMFLVVAVAADGGIVIALFGAVGLLVGAMSLFGDALVKRLLDEDSEPRNEPPGG